MWLCITRAPPLCFAARTAAPLASLLTLRSAAQHTTFHISASHTGRKNERKEKTLHINLQHSVCIRGLSKRVNLSSHLELLLMKIYIIVYCTHPGK